MVKYLKRKGNYNMTEEDRKELQELRKLKIKYKDLELKESQKSKTDNIVNNINNMAKDDNNKVDYLNPPKEKIEEDANENDNEEMEEIEEEVEEEVDEEEEGEGES